MMAVSVEPQSLTHDIVPTGDSSVWDKGGDESQLLVQRCRQPHSFHQNQNQRPQRGSIHHPPCRGGGHIRYVLFPTRLQLWHLNCSRFQVSYVCFLCTAPGIYSSTEMLDFGTLRSQGNSPYKENYNFRFLNYIMCSWPPLLIIILCFPTTLCCRSSKTAERTPIKFRNKRCSNYSEYLE